MWEENEFIFSLCTFKKNMKVEFFHLFKFIGMCEVKKASLRDISNYQRT